MFRELQGPGYVVCVFDDAKGTNSEDDNVDIEVRIEGGARYVGTLFTVSNVRRLMQEYETSGECARGLYFWAADMVLVRDLRPETIMRTVGDLIAENTLRLAFTKVAPSA